MVCEYAKDQALTVNLLWEIAYGVCHEALRLDFLEDFNATKADLMDMKNNILAMWKSRDKRRTSSLRPTFISLDCRPKGTRVHLGQNLHFWGGLVHPPVPLTVLVTVWVKHCHPSSLWCHHLGFPSTSGLSYIQELLPMSYPAVGTPMGYNFDPMTGQPLRPLMSSAHSLPSQPLGASFSTPTSPYITGLSTLPGAEQGGTSISGWVPVSLIPSGSGWKNTHCDCVLLPQQRQPYQHHLRWPQGSAPPVAMCHKGMYIG